jgi:hypothetical protein
VRPPLLWFSLAWALFLPARMALAAPVPLSAIPLSDEKMTATRVPETFDDVRLADIETGALEGDRIAPALIVPLDRPVCVPDYFAGAKLASDLDGKEPVEVDRLVTGADPFLERVVLRRGAKALQVTVRGRARLPLVRLDVALPMYAYRTESAVVVLIPRGFDVATDAFMHLHGIGVFVRKRCGYETIAIPIAGGVASENIVPQRDLGAARWAATMDQASGLATPSSAPATRPWIVNVSVSKVSRDPEPIVSVFAQPPPVAE